MSVEVRPARREELQRVNELHRQVNELHVKGRPSHFKPYRVYMELDTQAGQSPASASHASRHPKEVIPCAPYT